MNTQVRTSNILAAIGWLILITVMYGGYSLLGLIGDGVLTEGQEQFFRAGHGHAGVLTGLSIVYALCLPRTGWRTRTQVATWATYVVGVLLVSGSFFLHLALGTPEGSVATNVVTPVGAVVLAGSVIALAVGLARRPAASLPS